MWTAGIVTNMSIKNLFSTQLIRSIRRSKVVFQHIRAMSTEHPDDEVLMERINNTGVFTMNRPKALNALTLPMIRKMYPQLKEWEKDPDVSFVLIKAVGDKAFCAGGDIVAITDPKRKAERVSELFFKEEYILNHAIGTLGKPWIALINGITMGGGVGLSVHGQYRIATEKTVFAMPETAIGLFPDVGGGYFLPRLPGKLGVYLALTGFRLKGKDVQQAGVATHFVETAKLPALEKDLLSLGKVEPGAIHDVIQSYSDQCELDKDKPFILGPHIDNIDRLFSAPTLEGIFSDLEKDGSEWALKQLNTLKKMSPSSMKVTLKQLQRGGKMSLQEVLTMEYRITQHCVAEKDFHEGVRAILVDKDQNPKWNPATIEELTDDKVEWYFSELPPGVDLTWG